MLLRVVIAVVIPPNDLGLSVLPSETANKGTAFVEDGVAVSEGWPCALPNLGL